MDKSGLNKPTAVSRLRRFGAAWLLLGALVAVGTIGALTTLHPFPTPVTHQTEDAQSTEAPDQFEWDDSKYQFCQHDSSYSDLPYWNGQGTVGDDGCGLCAYTTMVDLLCSADYTPKDMLILRGDWAGQEDQLDSADGTPDGSAHREFTFDTFGIIQYAIAPTVDEARIALSDNTTVLLVGTEGSRTYHDNHGNPRNSNGHLVCFYRCDSSGFYCHDSAFDNDAGSAILYTDTQFEDLLTSTRWLIACTNPALNAS